MNLSNQFIIKESWESIHSIISQWPEDEEKSKLLFCLTEAIQLKEGENYKIEMEEIYENFTAIYAEQLVKSSHILDNLIKIKSTLDKI